MTAIETREADSKPLFVHLSDIHFDTKNTTLTGPNAVCREALISDLAEGAVRLGKPDAVLVTGDIAFSGKAREYDQAREFLTRVTGAVGIEPEKVLVIPGNHDVDRALVSTSVQMLHDQLRSKEPLEADLTLQRLFKEPQDPLFSPMEAYSAFALGFDCHVVGAEPAWEVPMTVGKTASLKIRGITTSAVSDEHDERGKLIIGTDQTTFASANPREIGVLLGHHPTDWWKDYDECEQHMKGWVSVHFYGHKHVSQVTIMNDSIRVVAGAVHPERHSDWLPGYNWVRLGISGEFTPKPRLAIELWGRRFPPTRNQFTSDTEAGGWESDLHSVRLRRWEKQNEIEALRAARDGADADGRSELVTTADAKGDDAEPTDVGAEEHPRSTNEETVSHRAPLADSQGRPQRLRTAIYKFGALGFGDQTRLLAQFDLVRDGDELLRPSEAQVQAFKRLGESGRTEEFIAAIEELTAEEGR